MLKEQRGSQSRDLAAKIERVQWWTGNNPSQTSEGMDRNLHVFMEIRSNWIKFLLTQKRQQEI